MISPRLGMMMLAASMIDRRFDLEAALTPRHTRSLRSTELPPSMLTKGDLDRLEAARAKRAMRAEKRRKVAEKNLIKGP